MTLSGPHDTRAGLLSRQHALRIAYIDNNILGRDQDWDVIATLCRSTPQLRVAISVWHLVELASASDRLHVLRRADFKIVSTRCGCMAISQSRSGSEAGSHGSTITESLPRKFSVFTGHLSEVWSTYVGPQTVIGLNARKWVAIVHDLSDLNLDKVRIIDALSTLQTATPQQKKQIEQETFLRWVLPRINDRDPNGRAITRWTKA